MDTRLYSALIPHADSTTRDEIAKVLSKFGQHALGYAAKFGATVRALKSSERYDEASPALRRLGVDVDNWPAPPSGLFVVEERTVYLRSRSAMTVAHEFGHALDCALGSGVYRSSVDPEVRALFNAARAYVTPYAATATDEYFAECCRAWVECNDEQSFWPRVSRARLQRVDPGMFALLQRIFADFESG